MTHARLASIATAFAIGGLPVVLPWACLFPDDSANVDDARICGDGGDLQCTSPPPPGWAIAVRVDGGACPAGFDIIPGNHFLDGGPACPDTCGCTVSGDPNLACEYSTVTFFSDDSCTGAPCNLATDAGAAGCTKFPDPGECKHVIPKAVPQPGATCELERASVDVLPPRQALLCAPRDPGFGCSGTEYCLPGEATCYFKAGDAGGCFDDGLVPELVYASVSDGRTCRCGCEVRCDVGSVTKKGNMCTCDPNDPRLYVNQCGFLGDAGSAAIVPCGDLSPSCEASVKDVEGEVRFGDPITLCCKKAWE